MSRFGRRLRSGAAAFAALALIQLAPGQVLANEEAAEPLVAAAKAGDEALALELLGGAEAVDAVDASGTTALAYAVFNRNHALAEALLDAGANPNLTNEYGVGPLLIAIKQGNAELVTRLINGGADPDAALWSGETPLMFASRQGDLPIVTALIDAGAEVDTRDERHGQTALMWAAAAGNTEIARTLIAAGADVSAATPRVEVVDHHSKGITTDVMQPAIRGEFTPLMFAVQSENTETVEALLDAGADVNRKSAEGWSPLLLSVYHHKYMSPYAPRETQVVADVPTATLLIERGADVNAANAYGVTPLAAAAFVSLGHDLRGQQSSIPEYMTFAPRHEEAEAVTALLLANGADPNIPIADYRIPVPRGADRRAPARYTNISPFLLAGALKQSALVEMMMASGRVDVHERRKNGDTPLMAAVRVNSISAVRALVEAGADVNAANDAGERAVHLAAVGPQGAGPIIEYLLQNGAELDVATNAGETPFTLAQTFQPPLLLRAGLRYLEDEDVAAGLPFAYMVRGIPESDGERGREYLRARYAEAVPPEELDECIVGCGGTGPPTGDPLPRWTQLPLTPGQTMFDSNDERIGTIESVEAGTVVIAMEEGRVSVPANLVMPGKYGPATRFSSKAELLAESGLAERSELSNLDRARPVSGS